MGGLATAWELSRGDWRRRLESITVYQRGWRLGGKGASSRGPNGRIEEHGLHVLLGYYDATFRMMREVYAELDRPATDPDSPIVTWEQAVSPSPVVGLTDRDGAEWQPWVTEFAADDRVPGEPGSEDRPLTVVDLVSRSLRLLLDFHHARRPHAPGGGVRMSASPLPAPRTADPARAARAAGLTTLAASFEVVSRMTGRAPPSRTSGAGRALAAALGPLRDELETAARRAAGGRRTIELVDLVFTNLRGVLADRLLTRPDGFAAVDHMDYRDWLRRHGADASTIDSAIVRGMYDLVFAYEDGDPSRPRFSAGLGLQLATRMLFDFKGAIFWRMQAGMGEVIFAPLYQALRGRGVRFRFFHRIDDLRLSPDQRSIAAVALGRQVDLGPGIDEYRPLAKFGGLACWPATPDRSQLAWGDLPDDADLESFAAPRDDAASVELVHGRDFDMAVLAVSLGMVPHVCAELLRADRRWRDMVDHVATVPTQSFQLWLSPEEAALGWRGPAGVTLSAYAQPFSTWASMSHLAVMEGWPAADRPGSIAYFCGVMPAAADTDEPKRRRDEVRAAALRFLDDGIARLWPDVTDGAGGFRFESLHAAGERIGPARFDSQYWRANIDPSDRYVQSLPGTDRYRIAPDDTGFANLAIAGDWTDCGLNAGCLEAAVRSGKLAARAVESMNEPSRMEEQP